MRTGRILLCLAVGLALAGVAVPTALADDPVVVCTMSMPPTCETTAVVCTMSMPPECRTDG